MTLGTIILAFFVGLIFFATVAFIFTVDDSLSYILATLTILVGCIGVGLIILYALGFFNLRATIAPLGTLLMTL